MLKKIFISMMLLLSFNLYGFGDFADVLKDITEGIEEANKANTDPNPQTPAQSQSNKPDIPTKSSSNNNQIELKDNVDSIEKLGISAVASFEHKALGLGLTSGDTNKFNSKAFAVLSAVNKLHLTRLNPDTEYARQLINNPDYGVINGYEIISEVDDQPTRMGQPKNPAQGKWSYKIKVDIKKILSKNIKLKMEKDQRTLYVTNIGYVDCNSNNTGASEAEAIKIALNRALISYHELKTNRRNLIPGNILQKKWLNKDYGLIESYEVIKSYKDPYLGKPVVKLKIVLANYKNLPNAEKIEQDVALASPLNPVAQEYDRALKLRVEATGHYTSALGAKLSHADEQEREEQVLHLGSQLGDTGDKTIVITDDATRIRIVAFLDSSPEMSPAALNLLEKGKQKDIVAVEIARKAPQKMAQVQKTGCEDAGLAFTYFERQVDVAAEKSNVVAALDNYYSKNPTINKRKEAEIEKNLDDKLLAD